MKKKPNILAGQLRCRLANERNKGGYVGNVTPFR